MVILRDHVLVLSFVCLTVSTLSCSNRGAVQSSTNAECAGKQTQISKETAVLIGKGKAIFDSDFRSCDVVVTEEPSAWRVNFELKEKGVDGGCPRFLIDKENGDILQAVYPK